MTEQEKQIQEMAFNLIMATSPLGVKDLTKVFDYNTVAKDLYELYGWRKERQGEWISVEEKLPEIPKREKQITVLGYNGEIHDYIIDSENRWWGYDGWDTPNGFGITHWMPLPTPPKMKGAE